MLRNLKLSRPLVFFDLETTGTDTATDRIVEFCFRRISEQVCTLSELVNPTIKIPAEATAVHKITDSMVSECKTFVEHASEILEFTEGCDLAGFNIKRFDLKLLIAEFNRAQIKFSLVGRKIIDVMEIYHHHERRDLAAAVQFYTGETMQDAHKADIDVSATIAVLEAQVDRYELPSAVEEIDAKYRLNGMDIGGCFTGPDFVFTFGKHKGKSIEKADSSYLQWFMGQDFFDDAKLIVSNELLRRRNS